MTEKRRRKLMRDAAEEVCWGLTVALNVGMTRQEALDFVAPDFDRWAELVDWENHR